MGKIEKELAAGYQRIKIKIKPGWDLDAVERVRKTFGPIPLQVDANAAYTLDDARAARQARSVRSAAHRAAARLRRCDGPRGAADSRSRRRSAWTNRFTPCASPAMRSRRRPAGSSTSSRDASAGTRPRSSCTTSARRTASRCGTAGCSRAASAARTTFTWRACRTSRLPGDIAASKRYYQPDLIDPPIDIARRWNNCRSARTWNWCEYRA